MSFMSPNKSFAKSGSEGSAMHLQLGLWPSPCTCRRAGPKWRKSRKTCAFMEAAVEDRKGKSSYCARHHPYPEFILQYSSPEGSHWEMVQEDWTRWLGSRLLCCYQEDPEPEVIYKTQTAIEAEHLQTLSRSKDCAQQLELVTRAMSGLPNQKRANKIHIWAAQCGWSEVPMNEQHT